MDKELRLIGKKEILERNLSSITEERGLHIQSLISAVHSSNIMGVILKSHLYIEVVINRILQEHLKNPQVLTLERIPFSSRIKFTFALGLISKKDYKFLKNFNELRNKYSHTLNYKLSKKEAIDIFYLMPVEYQKISYNLWQKYHKDLSIEKLPVTKILRQTIVAFYAVLVDKEAVILRQEIKKLEAIANAQSTLNKYSNLEEAS